MCVQLTTAVQVIQQQNTKDEYTISFKCDVEDFPRFRRLFVSSQNFPTIRQMDTMVLSKADIRVPVKNVRAKTMEGLVS